jgi:WD40 repeat protein
VITSNEFGALIRIAVSPDGNTLAIAGNERSRIELWDISGGLGALPERAGGGADGTTAITCAT